MQDREIIGLPPDYGPLNFFAHKPTIIFSPSGQSAKMPRNIDALGSGANAEKQFINLLLI
jgi:hypothetical protein